MAQVTEQDIRHALKGVFDPEITVNVNDLGLIYDVYVTENENGKVDVEIFHTLTSVMCPYGDQICNDIYRAACSVEGVENVKRHLTFEPPFSIEMVPFETKVELGLI